MNLVLLEADELIGDEVLLTGRRGKHLLEVLRVAPGDTVRVGVINGLVGGGTVLEVTSRAVRLAVKLERPPEACPPIELILALPRPIMLQRILKQATVLGVRRFHLIRSRRVEKSFFHSPVLTADKLRALLAEGLEQAMDTRLPEVCIHHQFKPFVEDVLPGLAGQGLIAHPEAAGALAALPAAALAGPLLLAVGPEGGWSEHELTCFSAGGFLPFSMGRRILHVDTAVITLLGQLQLLFDLRHR